MNLAAAADDCSNSTLRVDLFDILPVQYGQSLEIGSSYCAVLEEV
jgi:hypothetical protein